MSSDPERGDCFWRHLSPQALHPVAVQTIEALLWIERPLALAELRIVFDRRVDEPVLIAAVEQLIEMEILVLDRTRQVRGVRVRWFRLTEGRGKDE